MRHLHDVPALLLDDVNKVNRAWYNGKDHVPTIQLSLSKEQIEKSLRINCAQSLLNSIKGKMEHCLVTTSQSL